MGKKVERPDEHEYRRKGCCSSGELGEKPPLKMFVCIQGDEDVEDLKEGAEDLKDFRSINLGIGLHKLLA